MDHADIQEVIGAYVDSAKRAVEAGFEGVEVIGSAGYLPAQFASPVTNRREDGYGGDFEGRSRFGRELVSSLKKRRLFSVVNQQTASSRTGRPRSCSSAEKP